MLQRDAATPARLGAYPKQDDIQQIHARQRCAHPWVPNEHA